MTQGSGEGVTVNAYTQRYNRNLLFLIEGGLSVPETVSSMQAETGDQRHTHLKAVPGNVKGASLGGSRATCSGQHDYHERVEQVRRGWNLSLSLGLRPETSPTLSGFDLEAPFSPNRDDVTTFWPTFIIP